MNNDFTVDLTKLEENRKDGISGILRVKNDAEFLRCSIESCIGALDELIIVYNECNDDSPEIIQEMANKYPDKIKIFEYLPFLYNGSLNEEDYNRAKKEPENSVHLLSNYCNFGLSKSNYKYVLKIDADQVYDSERLKEICDAYRSEPNSLKIGDYIIYGFGLIYVGFAIKMHLRLPYHRCFYKKYYKTLLNFINSKKIKTSLSGMNIFIDSLNNKYIPLGGDGILAPFNGWGDTIIWKVSNNTYFVPLEDSEYNRNCGIKYQIIEKLIGVEKAMPMGLVWAHFNSCRKNIYSKNLKKKEEYPDKFMEIDSFLSNREKKLRSRILYPLRNSYEIIFQYLHPTINQSFISHIKRLKYLNYTLDE